MSNNEGKTSKVPPLYSSHSARHDWLYNKPALKSQTQPRFDPAFHLNRTRPAPGIPKKEFWLVRLFRKNPRRFTIVASSTSVFMLYNGFIFDIFIFPAVEILRQAREAFLPASMVDFKIAVSKVTGGHFPLTTEEEAVKVAEKVSEKK